MKKLLNYESFAKWLGLVCQLLVLKCAFYLSFAACFVDELFSYPRYAFAHVNTAKGKGKL